MDKKEKRRKICGNLQESLEQRVLFKGTGDSIKDMKQSQVMDGIKRMINGLGFIY